LAGFRFITNHACALGYLAGHPEARLRDIAAALDVTERTALTIVTELDEAGYLIRKREGRRNRYQVQPHVVLSPPISHRTVGDLVELVIDLRDVPDETERPEGEVPSPMRRADVPT